MNCSKEEYRYYRAFSNFPKGTLLAFNLYKSIYKEIPMELRLSILLKLIYGEFIVESDSFINLIQEILADETKDIKLKRLQYTHTLLKDYIEPNGSITVYRGIHDHNKGVQGISYTLDKRIAQLFSLHGSSSQVITSKVLIKDILAVNTNINELEVITLSMNPTIVSIESVKYKEELIKNYQQQSNLYNNQLTKFIRKMEI